MTEPTKIELDTLMVKMACQELEGKHVGTIAMFSEGCGVKKMGFRWMVKVFGWKVAIRSKIKDWQA